MKPYIKNLSTALLCFLLISGAVHGQNKISNELEDYISTGKKGELIKIRVEFDETVDFYRLKKQFQENNTPIANRPRIVIQLLKEKAQKTQKYLFNYLNDIEQEQYRNVKPFWITNIVVLEIRKELIPDLQYLPHVAWLDAQYDVIEMHDPIIVNKSRTSTPGGVEPGLEAINAPKMWAMGYTGRGRMVYDYDTGVWPTHPAFADRFIANRFPMNQSWIGYFSQTPTGQIGSHGTHTLGTMAGLVEETNDTLGVAFKSYWIANDFVTSTVQELPPLENMVEAFEWALNPDGNDSTTHDVPDVINNSWRWRDDPDTVECSGYIVDLMNAIEAAGIANVFSGGNSGPSNTTVNSPQRINTSEVNTFSVGSINATDYSFPYPISSFSTRGPTQCSGPDSLLFHPQVVAPGQNVRSAWGTDEYNTISGTSMAAPHVSGAILLLKEAFPFLSGEELLYALYNTAIDLGSAGNDNTYGKGLIDVYAAYQLLAGKYTPVDPTSIPYDLAIKKVINPSNNLLSCESSFTPEITVQNLGDSTITGITIQFNFFEQAAQSYTWNGTFASGDTLNLTLPAISATTYGKQELTFKASISGLADSLDYDVYNNYAIARFHRSGTFSVPFFEGFDTGLDSNFWYVENTDDNVGWDSITTNEPNSNMAAGIKLYSYDPIESQPDGLISSSIALPDQDSLFLKFDLAYQLLNVAVTDEFLVMVSENCGSSYQTVYSVSGDSLNTFDTLTADFVPYSKSQWKTKYIDLANYRGKTINLKFETINHSGNNLFVDNIWVYAGKEPLQINSPLEDKIKLYPNPSQNVLYLETDKDRTEIDYVVRNILGESIMKGNIQSRMTTLDVSSFSNGVYFIILSSGKERAALRFIKH